ncbi:MAG: hypothetical protein HKN25_10135 [Pyrinomonadaceae bacterium]|nr:hypothetical protein [Pyrinomonadaceae bacterium]
MIRITSSVFLILATLMSVASCKVVNNSETGTSSTPQAESSSVKKNAARWDDTTANEFLTISELKKKKPTDTIYETEGYVVDSYECDCSPISGAFMFCKCPPDSITISERTQLAQYGELGKMEIRVHTNPDGFSRGRKYRFKVRILESDYNEKVAQQVDLVAFQPDVDSRVEKIDALKSIRDLKDGKTKPGTYEIEGVVTKIYRCPPCPPLSQCSPCRRGNSLAVADKNGTSDGTELNENEILIATETPDSFEKGKRYKFTVRFLDEKLPNDPDFFAIKLQKYEMIEN